MTSPNNHNAGNSKVFLQKLYKIVSDPSTNDIICWSEAGDSFFVHDQERLGKLLGHWFKHTKFTSFVRQLNNYGFHKVLDLQQGVLRSDPTDERSQFAHPDFHRGQEDRLFLIERKKNTPSNVKEQGIVDFPALPRQSAPQVPIELSTGSVLDFDTLVNGIAAMRLHQSNISAELNDLRHSNQLLWKESNEIRAQQRSQQNTLDQVVQFLSLFVQHATPPPPGLRSSQLMIEDGNNPEAGIVELQDEGAVANQSSGSTPQTSSSPFFAATPDFEHSMTNTPTHHNSPRLLNLSPDMQHRLHDLINHNQGFSADSVDLNSFQQSTQQNLVASSSTPSSQAVVPYDFDILDQLSPLSQQQTPNGTNDLMSFDASYMDQWNKTADLEQQVNSMESQVDKLVHDAGPIITNAQLNQGSGGDFDTSVFDDLLPLSDPVNDDHALFDSFMHPFSSSGSNVETVMDFRNSDSAMDMSSTPIVLSGGSPAPTVDTFNAGLGNANKAQKRKSDVSAHLQLDSPQSPNAKRRKEQ